MIPDQLRWSLFRRRHFSKTLVGFNAHFLTYATPSCSFDECVSLHRNSKLFSCQLKRTRYITGATLSNVSAGKFCSIEQGVRIGLGRHPADFLSTHPSLYSSGAQTPLKIVEFSGFDEANPVVLGNDVWIGANSLIMGGIAIGDGAIVGAGSIVTKDISAYAVAVGCPAKVIRYRFDERTVSSLLSLQWWNMSDEEIRRLSRLVSPTGPIDPFALARWIETQLPLKE
jgi:acetyltransferase-like isoleucine patch superfamily enzyme